MSLERIGLPMLHVVNGEAALGALRATSLKGDAQAFPDMLMEGPATADWERRAEYLEQHHGIPRTEYLAKIGAFREALAKEAPDEVVLWFEDACWFCAANLLGLLAGPYADGLPGAKLSLVLSRERLGGRTAPAELERLLASRKPVTAPLRALARATWDVYAAPDPRVLEQMLLHDDFAAWPLLKQGLQAHAQRFPSTRNGLNLMEEAIVRLLAEQPGNVKHLFPRLQAQPGIAPLGIGDSQALAAMWELAKARTPLLSPTTPAAMGSMRALESVPLKVTQAGRDVLAGAQDNVKLNPIDRWLGGVELFGRGPVWRWDAAAARFVEA